MLAFKHYIDIACLELARDFQHGVSVAEREELIGDVVMIAWALSEGKWRVWS